MQTYEAKVQRMRVEIMCTQVQTATFQSYLTKSYQTVVIIEYQIH